MFVFFYFETDLLLNGWTCVLMFFLSFPAKTSTFLFYKRFKQGYDVMSHCKKYRRRYYHKTRSEINIKHIKPSFMSQSQTCIQTNHNALALFGEKNPVKKHSLILQVIRIFHHKNKACQHQSTKHFGSACERAKHMQMLSNTSYRIYFLSSFLYSRQFDS